MNRRKVFVSYTKRGVEGRYLWQLFDRLRKQRLEVWVYESAEEEIRGGQQISEELRRKLEESDVFLPIVTVASFDSAYTRLETAHALVCHTSEKRLQIIPFVSRDILETWIGPWPDPYQALSSLRYRIVDLESRASIESAILDLCVDVKVEYQPPIPEHPRLPFLDRFVAEIWEKCPRRNDREIGLYIRLMDIFTQFALSLDRADHHQCCWLMSFFCATCQYEFPSMTLYYGSVTNGVCQVLLGRLDEAMQTFEGLLNHPRVDECTYGAMGYISQQRGRFADAKVWYRRASECCPSDPAARVGVAINSVLAGETVDAEAEFGDVDLEQIPTDDDRLAFQVAYAIALLSASRIQEAMRIFMPLVETNSVDVPAVVLFANHLERQGKNDMAVDMLERVSTKTADPDVIYELALSTAFRGNRNRALTLLQGLIERYPRVRQYRIDAAQLLWHCGELDEARSLCVPLLNPSVFPLPQTANDFYLDGFANWLLGHVERAEYDFRRSGFPAGSHYRILFPSLATG